MTERETVPAVSDQALATEARHNPAAFAELYQRHVRRIYRYGLARLGNHWDAEDFTAHLFETAFRSIGQYRGDGPFAAWLLAIARNQLITRYRSRQVSVSLDSLDGAEGDDVGPDDVAARRLQLATVLQALQAMPAAHAEVIRLRIIGEFSTAETARIMHRSEAAVKMLLHRALRELRLRYDVGAKEEAGYDESAH